MDRRNTFLFAGAFLFSLAVNILIFSLVYLLVDKFSMTSGQVGFCLALGYVFYFLGCALFHKLEAWAKPARILPLSVISCLFFLCLLWWTPSPVLSVAAYGLFQAGIGFFWPPLMGWFTQGLSGRQLDRNMGRFNQSWISGNLLAPFAGGAIYRLGQPWAFWAIFALLLLVFLILSRLFFYFRKNPDADLQHPPQQPDDVPDSGSSASFGGAPQDHTQDYRRFRLASWLSVFSVHVFLGLVINVIPLMVRDEMGYTESSAGLLLFFRGLAAFAGFSLIALFVFWHFNRRWIAGIQAALFVLALLFFTPKDSLFGYGVLLVAFGFLFAGSYNNSLYHSGTGGTNPGKSMALHEIFITIGSAAGALAGGFIYQVWGFRGAVLFLVSVQFVVLLLLIFLLFVLPRKNETVRPKAAAQKEPS